MKQKSLPLTDNFAGEITYAGSLLEIPLQEMSRTMSLKRTMLLISACFSTFMAFWMTYRFFFCYSSVALWGRIMTAPVLLIVAILAWRQWLIPGLVKPPTLAERIGVACLATFQAMFLVSLAVIPEWRHGLNLLLFHRDSNFDIRLYIPIFIVGALWYWWQALRHWQRSKPTELRA